MTTSTSAPARAAISTLAAVSAAAALVLALVLCRQALSDAIATRAVVWGALALASYAAALLCLTGPRDDLSLGLARWKFGPWTLLWYGVTFGLATVTWSRPQISVAADIAVSSVLRALWLTAVGMTCLIGGYCAGPGEPLRQLARRGMATLSSRVTGTVRSRSTPWVLYAAGTAARLASTATTGRFGYVGDAASAVSSATGYAQILTALTLLAPMAVCAAAVQVYWERQAGARVTMTILFLTELIFGAAAGGKQSFIIAVLAIVIPMSAKRRRMPTAALIVVALFFLAVVVPFNQAYRNVARSGSGTLSPSEAIHQAPGILEQTLTGHSALTLIPNSAFYLLQRVREIDSPAIIVQRTPGQIAFSSPAQLVEAPFVSVIPRAVWAAKPILASGYQFSQQYYGLPANVYTSSAITPVGDLYRHGGWIPVIAGMFLLGCAIRLLDDVLDVRASPHAVFLILLLFPTLVKSEDDWVTLVAGIPETLLIWLLVVALTFRPRRAQ